MDTEKQRIAELEEEVIGLRRLLGIALESLEQVNKSSSGLGSVIMALRSETKAVPKNPKPEEPVYKYKIGE
jgi:hypothetical protein